MSQYAIYCGDTASILKTIPSECVHCVITSPPYWGLRDYGVSAQIGLEDTLEEYVEKITEVFNEIKRVLKKNGTVWLNLGDSYAGSGHGYGSEIKGKQKTNRGALFMAQMRPFEIPEGLKVKDLVGIPWRIAFALQANGWYLRSDIIWHKPNPMPESVKDRPTKSHEYLFFLTKTSKYYYDIDAIREPHHWIDHRLNRMEQYRKKVQSATLNSATTSKSNQSVMRQSSGNGNESGRWRGRKKGTGTNRESVNHPLGRNKRTVWTVPTQPFKEAHFATFPEKLVEPCLLAGCPPNGLVLDPFCGSGTTGVVALRHHRNFIGIELNPKYVEMAEKRITETHGLFAVKSAGQKGMFQ
jgi:DNA modification methylase